MSNTDFFFSQHSLFDKFRAIIKMFFLLHGTHVISVVIKVFDSFIF